MCLLHAYVNDAHEKTDRGGDPRALPELAVSISSGIAREIREYERMSTTVGERLRAAARAPSTCGGSTAACTISRPDAPLRIMVSSGGFTSGEAAAETPILLLESGPAGGVLSALNTARNNGIDQILAFDMGGTTAKACVAVGGEPLIAHSFEAARVHRFKRGSGLPILIPSIDLIEIGAGGGSIAHVNDLGLLNVGPESAGADPGPGVLRRRAAPSATVTDADLVLGYLNADNFLGGEMKLRRDLAEAALAKLAGALKLSDDRGRVGHLQHRQREHGGRRAHPHRGERPRSARVRDGRDRRRGAGARRRSRAQAADPARARDDRRGRGLVPRAARRAGARRPQLVESRRSSRTSTGSASRRCMRTCARTPSSELASARRGRRRDQVVDRRRDALRGAGPQRVGVAAVADDRRSPPKPRSLKEFEKRYRQLYGHLVPNAAPQVITWRLTGRSVVKSHRFTWGDARVSTKPVMRGKREIYLPLRGKYARGAGLRALFARARHEHRGPGRAGRARIDARRAGAQPTCRMLPDYTVSVHDQGVLMKAE